jgi:N-acetyl-1-D-myo-inositol-2-amino-2-deoxy-alpha-D-glucopyranoside deacetylase
MVRPRFLAVFAHPDDDAYGVGGTLVLEQGAIEPHIILATSGGAGEISDPALAQPENLAEVREGEERAAVSALGWPELPVHFLRFPDGGLIDVDRAELVDRLAELMTDIRPHVVVTFGPEGVTKHDDHITIGQATTEAFHRVRAEAGGDQDEAFRVLYYNGIPQSGIAAFWQSLRDRGVDVGDTEGPFMPRGVPDETIMVRVDCSSVMQTKLEGIKAHATQWNEMALMPPELLDRFLSEETFVQAWPPVEEPKGSVAGSLFDGVRSG